MERPKQGEKQIQINISELTYQSLNEALPSRKYSIKSPAKGNSNIPYCTTIFFQATVTTKTVQVTTSIPVYATCKKVSKTELEDCPVYENYDFQEQAIYQNMMVSPKGRMIPAKNVKSNDVYAQVKFLRMSVQEVNAIIGKKYA